MDFETLSQENYAVLKRFGQTGAEDSIAAGIHMLLEGDITCPFMFLQEKLLSFICCPNLKEKQEK